MWDRTKKKNVLNHQEQPYITNKIQHLEQCQEPMSEKSSLESLTYH